MCSRYSTSALIRAWTDSSEDPRRDALNASPQTGMSGPPWFFTGCRPSMIWATSAAGNTPPFLAANCVRSGGGFFMFAASGPSPCADVPWHAAQYALKSSLPLYDCCVGKEGGSCARAAAAPSERSLIAAGEARLGEIRFEEWLGQ